MSAGSDTPPKYDPEKVGRTVLFEVIELHPERLTVAELSQRIAVDPEDGEEIGDDRARDPRPAVLRPGPLPQRRSARRADTRGATCRRTSRVGLRHPCWAVSADHADFCSPMHRETGEGFAATSARRLQTLSRNCPAAWPPLRSILSTAPISADSQLISRGALCSLFSLVLLGVRLGVRAAHICSPAGCC